jgi:hypothetical protein
MKIGHVHFYFIFFQGREAGAEGHSNVINNLLFIWWDWVRIWALDFLITFTKNLDGTLKLASTAWIGYSSQMFCHYHLPVTSCITYVSDRASLN